MTIGECRIPLEVEYCRAIDAQRDTIGLRSFLGRVHNHAPFGVLVTMHEDARVPDPRIVPVSLRSQLLMR